MLLIIGSRLDPGAAALAQRWQGHDARLLTCEALSRRGWVFDPAEPARGSFVVDDGPVPIATLRGAVSLLWGVSPSEVPQIAHEDREYVASEMMAFLVAWLSALPCPLLNRPTPVCLAGPHLRQAQWLREAAKFGLPIGPWAWQGPDRERRAAVDVAPSPPRPRMEAPLQTVAVVAGRPIPGCAGPAIPHHVQARVASMATGVGAGLLTATFAERDGGHEFIAATPTVDVSRDDIADAMLAALVPAR